MPTTPNLSPSSAFNHNLIPQPDQKTASRNNVLNHALVNGKAGIHPEPIRVLIGEPLGPVASNLLKELSSPEFQLRQVPTKKGETTAALTQRIADAMKGQKTDLLVIRGNCRVNSGFIEQLSDAEKPAHVLRAGTGMDNLDTEALRQHQIGYSNTPHVNTQSTAEHAIALMLTVKRKTAQADQMVKQGQWDRTALTGSELNKKTLGIIGTGQIGSRVAEAAQALGMNVIGLAPRNQAPEHAEKKSPSFIGEYVSMDELCSKADVVSLHVPLTDSTRNIIGARQIEQLSGRDAVIINTARGGLIDETALLTALEDNSIAGAGIDVFEEDPAPPNSASDRLARHAKVVATPHIGGQTIEASELMGEAVVQQAKTMRTERDQAQIH